MDGAIKSPSTAYAVFRGLTLTGNILFVLWMLLNGMNEGWRATSVELASYIGFTLLLMLNSVLLFSRK